VPAACWWARQTVESTLTSGQLNAEQHRGSAQGEAIAWIELAKGLGILFLQTGDERLLDELITVSADAYRIAPHGTAVHARAGHSLGEAQLFRAMRRGDLAPSSARHWIE
jgi:hypothetical protein